MTRQLTVIAGLFLLFGGKVFVEAFQVFFASGLVQLDVGMLLVPTGIGLLRRHDFWRFFALVLVGVYALALIAIPILGYSLSPVFSIQAFGSYLAPGSGAGRLVVVSLVLGIFMVLGWMFWVLRHPKVMRQFLHRSNGSTTLPPS